MTIEDQIRKESAKVVRLKVARDKAYAVKASTLMREAMTLVEKMDTDPTLADAVNLMCAASDALSAWEPKH